jgi:RimJ/RimL family protein N-acetyltransferase
MAIGPQYGEKEEIKKFLHGAILYSQGTSLHQVLAIAKKDGGDFVGLCGLTPDMSGKGTECFYAVLPRFEGKGFASEAVVKLVEYALEKDPSLILMAHVTVDNAASIRVLEKAGFRDGGLIDYPLWPGPMKVFIFSK